MEKELKYSLFVQTNFHIQNFLSNNNRTNDSFFWMDDHDIDNSFHFSSALLSNLTDIQDVYDKANQILSIYEGIYKLLDRTKHYNRYFNFSELVDIAQNRIISRPVKSELYKIDIDFTTIEEKPENRPINPIYILFERVVKDDFLKNLFFLLSNKVDYRMLYIIYDDIRFYLKCNNDNAFLKGYSEQLKRFTHTANNYEVLGFFSRHGRTISQPPQSPMNLTDSMNLIFDIVVKLLEEKFNIKLPKFWGLPNIDFTEADIEDLFK